MKTVFPIARYWTLQPGYWIKSGWIGRGMPTFSLDLFLSYGTNVPLYPEFQAFFRQYQPPTLIVWGKNDFIFPPEGAAPYPRDLKTVETAFTGHGPLCA